MYFFKCRTHLRFTESSQSMWYHSSLATFVGCVAGPVEGWEHKSSATKNLITFKCLQWKNHVYDGSITLDCVHGSGFCFIFSFHVLHSVFILFFSLSRGLGQVEVLYLIRNTKGSRVFFFFFLVKKNFILHVNLDNFIIMICVCACEFTCKLRSLPLYCLYW